MARADLTGIGEIQALLGSGSQFEGKLTFEGRVRVDGKFRGEIFSDDVLVLGEQAEIHASIDVGTLIMRGGTLRGDVKARQLVELYAPARVYGNIEAPQLFLDKGVVFEGKCTMPTEATHEADVGAGSFGLEQSDQE
jgi:cytoskeletal protein CcmA (bactofilin family)